jgi:hypothetical protein
MKRHGFIKVLNDEQCKTAVGIVDDLYEYWVRREPEPWDFYTIGSTSYQEGMTHSERYTAQMNKMNPILKKNFEWIYDLVIEKLTEQIGPCEIIDDLGHPGFHVLGHPPGQLNNKLTMKLSQKPLFKIHEDRPYAHQKARMVWAKFKDVTIHNSLTWTLLLESPKCGSGLAIWDESVLKQYDTNKELSDYVRGLSHYQEYLNHRPPDSVVSYNLGESFFFKGVLLHQIAPFISLEENERRITMQGHGLLCDGIWRIFF